MLLAVSNVEELTAVEPVVISEQVSPEYSSMDVDQSVENQRESPVRGPTESEKERNPKVKRASVRNGRPPKEPRKLGKQQNFDQQEVKVKKRGRETQRRSLEREKPLEKPKSSGMQAGPEESNAVRTSSDSVQEEPIEPHRLDSGNSRK